MYKSATFHNLVLMGHPVHHHKLCSNRRHAAAQRAIVGSELWVGEPRGEEDREEGRRGGRGSVGCGEGEDQGGSPVVGSNLREFTIYRRGGGKAMSCRQMFAFALAHMQYCVDPHLDVHQDAQLGRVEHL